MGFMGEGRGVGFGDKFRGCTGGWSSYYSGHDCIIQGTQGIRQALKEASEINS